MKIFLSHCWDDEQPFNDIKECIKEVTDREKCNLWYDHDKLKIGNKISEGTLGNLKNSDMVILFISHAYLESQACKEEKKLALKLGNKGETIVFPIIVTDCDWRKDKKLMDILSYLHNNKPWCQLSDELKKNAGKEIQENLAEKIQKYKMDHKLICKGSFKDKLNDMGMLNLLSGRTPHFDLDDVFIHRKLQKSIFTSSGSGEMITEEISSKLMKYTRVLLHGDSLSGKTSLAYWMYKNYLDKGMIPVYIEVDASEKLSGNINNRIDNDLLDQYTTKTDNKIKIDNIDRTKIVPIIDNFHLANKQDEHVKQIEKEYHNSVLVYNDTFLSDIKKHKVVGDYAVFRPRELMPSERRKLVRKLIEVFDKSKLEEILNLQKKNPREKEHEYVTRLDEHIGKNIAGSMIPTYPVYILSMLVDGASISSGSGSSFATLGQYYATLLDTSISKAGVDKLDKNLYWNFLREMAFELREKNISSMEQDSYKEFIDSYTDKFPMYIETKDVIENLKKANIIEQNEQFIKFKYPYIYYFFVSEYISYYMNDQEHKMNKIVDQMVNKIGLKENAFILIFLANNDKKGKKDLIKKITSLLDKCMEHFEPAELTKKEIKDEKDVLFNRLLPIKTFGSNNPERTQIAIDNKDRVDDIRERNKEEKTMDVDSDDDPDTIDIKVSIRGIEVLGHILKNEFTTMSKDELQHSFESAIKNHLRITKYFFAYIEYVATKELDKLVEREKLIKASNNEGLVSEDNEGIKREIKSNLSGYYCLIGMATIIRITLALGSQRIREYLNEYCEAEKEVPAYFLINYFNDIMHKGGDFNKLDATRKIKDKDFPETCKHIMRALYRYYFEYNDISSEDVRERAGILKVDDKKLQGIDSQPKGNPFHGEQKGKNKKLTH